MLLSSSCSNKKSLKIGDGPEMRDRARCAAVMYYFGTKKQESEVKEVVLCTLLKLLVTDKLLHSRKVPVNAELRPLRREKQGSEVTSEVERCATLKEAIRLDGITFNFYTGLPHIHSHIHSSCPFTAQERLDSTLLKEHHVTRKLLI